MERPEPRGRVGAVWVAAALAFVVVLPLGVLTTANWEPLMGVDVAVSDELVVPSGGDEVNVLRFLTGGGDAAVRVVVLAPLAAWLAWQRKWRLFALVVAAGALVGAVNELLKSIFDRPRPSYDWTIDASGYSYPSGHASGTAAMVTVLVLVFWPVITRAWRRVLAALAITAAGVVGYTRIALGVHYASDVIAGWCVGVAWVLLLAVVLRVWPGQPGALPERRVAQP
jgi:membrane-associated phospholipid phosphatase